MSQYDEYYAVKIEVENEVNRTDHHAAAAGVVAVDVAAVRVGVEDDDAIVQVSNAAVDPNHVVADRRCVDADAIDAILVVVADVAVVAK